MNPVIVILLVILIIGILVGIGFGIYYYFRVRDKKPTAPTTGGGGNGGTGGTTTNPGKQPTDNVFSILSDANSSLYLASTNIFTADVNEVIASGDTKTNCLNYGWKLGSEEAKNSMALTNTAAVGPAENPGRGLLRNAVLEAKPTQGTDFTLDFTFEINLDTIYEWVYNNTDSSWCLKRDPTACLYRQANNVVIAKTPFDKSDPNFRWKNVNQIKSPLCSV